MGKIPPKTTTIEHLTAPPVRRYDLNNNDRDFPIPTPMPTPKPTTLSTIQTPAMRPNLDQSPRTKILKQVQAMLGAPQIDLHLSPEQWDVAFDLALSEYRYRSSNSLEERYAFIDLQPSQADYYLPEEVTEVKGIFRRNISGIAAQSGAVFDPFGAAFTNQFLLTGTNSNQLDLVTYELMTQYKSLLGRMFGFHVTYTWNAATKRLTVDRYVRAPETIMLWLMLERPETQLLKDPFASNWLRRYTYSQAKHMIGEVRSKYSSLGGPQGGVSFNGGEMKQEATAEIEKLIDELKKNQDSAIGYPMLIG